MRDFIITDFGARVCDRPQTKEIQAALDACFLAGGGRVIIPLGVFYTGCIRVRSNTVLYLETGAILRGSRILSDYYGYREDTLEPLVEPTYSPTVKVSGSVRPFSDWNSGIIKVIEAENVSIIGERGSYIDGCDVYNPDGEEKYRGPHAINMYKAKNVYLEGYTIMNSANWAHNIYTSSDITIKGVTVLGGHDGFDVRTCDNVLIEDCVFKSGDDCVAGFDNKNVVVRGCILDTACSALRFGGTDVLIENCTVNAPASYGFRKNLSDDEKRLGALPTPECRHTMHTPFQYYCDHRADIRYTPGNIVMRNCEINNPNALFLHPFDGEHQWCCNRPLSSFTYENCNIRGLSLPGNLCSDKTERLTFKMKNCLITSRDGVGAFPIFGAQNCELIELENVTVEGFETPFAEIDDPSRLVVKGGTPIEVRKISPLEETRKIK